MGAEHFGLPWAPEHPGHGAVNWGGYRAADMGGGELDGTDSALSGARPTRNTRDYPWVPNRKYRMHIFPTPGQAGAWRGEVTDKVTGETTTVRDLFGGGDRLEAALVWTECFADCDHRSATVRWTDLEAVTLAGDVVRPAAVRVTYQPHERGGCDNTSVVVVDGGVLQTTNANRQVSHGAIVRLG